MDSAQKQQIIDSTIPPSDPKESAIIATLQPGNYTAVLSGVGGATGVGSVELYDLDQSAPANPANISTRGFVETADNVMIAVFFYSRRLDLPARFGSVDRSGIDGGGRANALQDPFLELHNSSGTTVATNDSWRSNQEATSSRPALRRTTIESRRSCSPLRRALIPLSFVAAEIRPE